jgi:hypothetical protein
LPYTKRSRWKLSDSAYKVYKSHQNNQLESQNP